MAAPEWVGPGRQFIHWAHGGHGVHRGHRVHGIHWYLLHRFHIGLREPATRGRALQFAVEPAVLSFGHQHLNYVSSREAQQRVIGTLRVGNQGADSPGAAAAQALAEGIGPRALGAASVERGMSSRVGVRRPEG